MSDNILQYWGNYIKDKNGKIKKKNSTSIHERYEEYKISYINNCQFIVIVHVQQEPERGRGPYLDIYTKMKVKFNNEYFVSLEINKKSLIKKFFDKLGSQKEDLFHKIFYIKCSDSDAEDKILNNTFIKQTILSLNNAYINVYKNNENMPADNDLSKNSILEIHVNEIVSDELTIQKIEHLAMTILSIIHKQIL